MIWVIVDRLAKSAHFLPISEKIALRNWLKYISRILWPDMECLFLLYQTEMVDSCQEYGNHSKRPLDLN